MKLALLVGCLAAAPPLILVSLSLLKPASAAALDIHAAVREDSPLKIQDALEAGESVNKIGPGGQTPLMHGVLQGKLDAVEALLTAGADVTIGEKDGYTPMHGAGFQGRAAVAKALLAHGLDPSDRHQDGFTPLHRACWGGEQRHTDMVRVLLEAGRAERGKSPGPAHPAAAPDLAARPRMAGKRASPPLLSAAATLSVPTSGLRPTAQACHTTSRRPMGRGQWTWCAATKRRPSCSRSGPKRPTRRRRNCSSPSRSVGVFAAARWRRSRALRPLLAHMCESRVTHASEVWRVFTVHGSLTWSRGHYRAVFSHKQNTLPHATHEPQGSRLSGLSAELSH